MTICHPADATPLMPIVERREITEAAVQHSVPPSVTTAAMISRELVNEDNGNTRTRLFEIESDAVIGHGAAAK